MIKNIEINNYKGFKSLSLKKLGRVNVIVGPNSAGKTALLEAIFLTCGANPELALRIRAFRGFNFLAISMDKTGYEALWKDIFNDFDQSKTVQISLTGSSSFNRNLSIAYSRDRTMALELSSTDLINDNISPLIPIAFEWTLQNGKKITAEPTINNNNRIEPKFSESLEPLPISFFTSVLNATQEENARYFSALSVKNQESKIVKALKSEFAFINNLSVEIWSGTPCLFASVDKVNEKIPLSLVSSGVNKLISILLGIATQKGGVICIDEIENGFYYDRLPSIWKLILEFSTEFDVQIFASTHSWECLQAAAAYASKAKKENEFTLLQSIDDKAGFRVHTGKAFVDAVNHEIDVR